MICSGVHSAAVSVTVEFGTFVDAASVVGAVDALGSTCSIVASWRSRSGGFVDSHTTAASSATRSLCHTRTRRNHWPSSEWVMLMGAARTCGDRNVGLVKPPRSNQIYGSVPTAKVDSSQQGLVAEGSTTRSTVSTFPHPQAANFEHFFSCRLDHCAIFLIIDRWFRRAVNLTCTTITRVS